MEHIRAGSQPEKVPGASQSITHTDYLLQVYRQVIADCDRTTELSPDHFLVISRRGMTYHRPLGNIVAELAGFRQLLE